MNPKYLERLIAYTALSLLLLGSFSVLTTAKDRFSYTKLKVAYQAVRLQKPDGSISNAEFISDIILLPDGRANGGFGIWELSLRKLTLYHVVEGQRNGPFFTFKAERLSRVQSEVITFTFTVHTTQSSVPTGSVVFRFDGVRGSGDPEQSIVFVATGEANEGCVGGRGCDAALPEFGFIRAEPQTVVVQSLTGNYTASFEHITLVLSDDHAIGVLYLGRNDGSVQQISVSSGNIDFRNGEAIGAWLHGTTADSPLPVMIRIASEDLPSEPCRIYDILGTQGPVRLEAQGHISEFSITKPLD